MANYLSSGSAGNIRIFLLHANTRGIMKIKKIAVLIGSLRRGSYSRKMANTLIKLAPESLMLEIVEISDLPMYNQDLDEAPPGTWTEFRDRLKVYDGVLFVTPEYNRSVPAVLKNAIDVGSRPYGKSAWDGKPAAIVSITPGALGGFGANHHLRQSLVFLNVSTMPQPEAYIGGAVKLFDENGNLVNESTHEFLSKFVNAFAEWVVKNAAL
jgi:chromate reductase, NAD(P)H dehydrogenase (quinone)